MIGEKVSSQCVKQIDLGISTDLENSDEQTVTKNNEINNSDFAISMDRQFEEFHDDFSISFIDDLIITDAE